MLANIKWCNSSCELTSVTSDAWRLEAGHRHDGTRRYGEESKHYPVPAGDHTGSPSNGRGSPVTWCANPSNLHRCSTSTVLATPQTRSHQLAALINLHEAGRLRQHARAADEPGGKSRHAG